MKNPKINTHSHSETNHNNHHQKCVCEICNCGQHRCPEKSLKFQGQTTNNRDYQPYNIKPDRMEKMDYMPSQNHYDPNLIKSTYDSTYVPYKVQKDESLGQRYEYVHKGGQFYDQTQYKKNYIPNQIKVEQPFSDLQYIPNNTKFEGTTTYNQEYSKKSIHHTPQMAVQYQSKSIPFQGQTTYKDQFKPHQVQSINYQMQNAYIPKNAPFTGQSRYTEQYTGYRVQEKKICPTEMLPGQPRRCSPGKDHLHYSATNNRWQ